MKIARATVDKHSKQKEIPTVFVDVDNKKTVLRTTEIKHAEKNIYRATPVVTRALVFPVSSEGPPRLITFHDDPHLVASYDTQGDAGDIFLPWPVSMPHKD
jgi:hypothetical protein